MSVASTAPRATTTMMRVIALRASGGIGRSHLVQRCQLETATPSTPHCRLGLRVLEHGLQTSMMWAACRFRRDLEATMQLSTALRGPGRAQADGGGVRAHCRRRLAVGAAAEPRHTTLGPLSLPIGGSPRVEHVAMEVTGAYWKPVWHGARGPLRPPPLNAAHVKNVPRRRPMSTTPRGGGLARRRAVPASSVPPVAVQELRVLTRTLGSSCASAAAHVPAHREGP